MVARILGLLLLLLSVTHSYADSLVEPGDLTLQVVPEDLPYTPYEDEMILLKIQGSYRIPISLETLKQPTLDGFDWMQLGHDNWSEDSVRGQKTVRFERVMAIFPNRSGPLRIDPFIHHLTLVTKDGTRFERDVRSAPVTLDVLPRPEDVAWWLPVRSIRADDDWSNPPDALGPGEGALRIVKLDIRGVKPSLIPPMPELQAAGALAFPHPEKRLEKLGHQGPRAMVFWRWTVRPDKPPSAFLKPLRIPYFDSVTREQKEIVIASQRIAMSDEAIAEFEADGGEVTETLPRLVRRNYSGAVVIPGAMFGGMLGGLAFALFGSSLRNRKEMRAALRRRLPNPNRRKLRRAVRRSDAAGARKAALALRQTHTGDAVTQINAALADLDASLFGTAPASPDLKAFARRVLAVTATP